MLRNFLLSLGALCLAACVTPARIDAPPVPLSGAAPVGFEPGIRRVVGENRFDASDDPVIRRLMAASDGAVETLALSGGGAGGAFGAGVLVGLTRAGTQPQYEIVTGVSTGALIAPFAFLGSEWDARLTEAYTNPYTDNLLRWRGLGALFVPGLYRNEPLVQMIDRFLTDELLAAIAREDARGRMLLVATTNLDTGAAVIWDMGAIARRGAAGRRLFRDVLVASASVPAVFPPVMIGVEANGARFQEMHVDGGVATPFFLLPDMAALARSARPELTGARAFVVINGQLEPPEMETPRNTISIMSRSLEVNQIIQTRAALALAVSFAERNGMAFQFTRVPPELASDGPLDFDRDVMQILFAEGMRVGESGHAWQSAAEYQQAPPP